MNTKEFIKQLKELLEKFNNENECMIQDVELNPTVENIVGKERLLFYNIKLKINS